MHLRVISRLVSLSIFTGSLSRTPNYPSILALSNCVVEEPPVVARCRCQFWSRVQVTNSPDRKDARPRSAAECARPRRRGDRVMLGALLPPDAANKFLGCSRYQGDSQKLQPPSLRPGFSELRAPPWPVA